MKYFTPLFYFTLSVSTMTSCPHLLGTVPVQGLPVSAVAAAPDTSIAYSRAAAAEVRNQLQSLHSEAEYEAAMKLKCLRYEKTIQTQQSAQFELTTAPIWPALSDGAWSLKPAFRVGDYVQVSEDRPNHTKLVPPQLVIGALKRSFVSGYSIIAPKHTAPTTKILWVNYDEKWMYGFNARSTAKFCEALGIDKRMYKIYHKNHINKVMIVAVTGYAFDGNPENGGDGLKLGCYRVQAAKIAKKEQRASRKTEDGRTKYDGEVLREKGDCFLVDCTVTGSSVGTSRNPKFSLEKLFDDQVFPELEQLVGPGGQYEGYVVVMQGDNAGPHTDRHFFNFCKSYFDAKGWVWQPQGAQMPHANNLDLAVFPSMSKRHSDLLRERGGQVADADTIWQTAVSVWRELDSATIARGFVLAHRILGKVIENKGDNSFLGSGDFHCGVRDDFVSTATGIRRRQVYDI